MACTTMSIPTSPIANSTIDMFKEHKHNGLHRSHSSKELHNRASIRRSYSDNHLCYCVNRIHIQATATQPELKNNNRSMGIFPFQLPGSIFPNSLRSFLFNEETSKDMDIVEKDMNIEEENSGNSNEGEEIKRSNWVERLLEIRSHWRNRQQKESVDKDEVCDEDGIGDCDCGGDEGCCTVSYSADEEEEEEIYNRESFSRLLARVPWSDTKLFSKFAFLCNMAYVIPEIKVPCSFI